VSKKASGDRTQRQDAVLDEYGCEWPPLAHLRPGLEDSNPHRTGRSEDAGKLGSSPGADVACVRAATRSLSPLPIKGCAGSRRYSAEAGSRQKGARANDEGAHQGLFNPGSGLFGRPEQGRVPIVALAEPGFQVPRPPVLRGMVRPFEADEHGGKLVVCEDEPAVGVMAVDEHAHRHE